MPSAAGGGGRSTVRRRLAVLVAANLFVLLVVGVAGIVGTVRAHDSVHYLTGQIEPAARDNAHALQDLTDAETSAWGYGISGEAGLRTLYEQARQRFWAHRAELEKARSLDGQLGLLVDDFLLATDNWFQAYADPRVAGPVGPDTFDSARFDRARALFDDVRTTNAEVSARLAELSSRADDTSEGLKHSIVAILAAVLAVGAALSLLVARRIGRGVTEPLSALEQTAHRLAIGEHQARAPVDGPSEVVQVATAINAMADENDRARALEARVIE